MSSVNLRNAANGLTAECDSTLAEVLLARGGWELADKPASELELDMEPDGSE